MTRVAVAGFALLTCTLALRPSSAAAQPSPDPFPALGAIAPGTQVTIEDDRGRRHRGTIRSITGAALEFEPRRLNEPVRMVPLADLQRVVTADRRRDGFWKGFAVGAAPGVAFGVLLSQICANETATPDRCLVMPVVYGALTGLLGGGIGAALDGRVDAGAVVLDRGRTGGAVRLQPWLAPGGGMGAALSLGF